MKVLLVILTLTVVAAVCDRFLYLTVFRVRIRARGLLAVVAALQVLSDVAALSVLALYRMGGGADQTGLKVVMWLTWAFFLLLMPKVLYTAGVLAGRLAGRLTNRRRGGSLPAAGLWLSAAVMAVLVWGATFGRTALRVEHVEVRSARVPEAFDGYRIVQISDLHVGTMMRPERQLARVVAAVAAEGGDMVVSTGDVVNHNHRELTPAILEVLGRLRAPDGVWSVWGNHDLGFYIGEHEGLTPEENMVALSAKIEGLGWRTLSDRSVWIVRERGGRRDSMLLTGLDYPFDPALNGRNSRLAGVDMGEAFEGTGDGDPFNVVLAHTPNMWGEIVKRGRGDLTLSGHVHSMQMKFRALGIKLSPASLMYANWSGAYSCVENGKTNVLYVNDGIGCVGYPMRLGARGEITVITLRRAEASDR